MSKDHLNVDQVEEYMFYEPIPSDGESKNYQRGRRQCKIKLIKLRRISRSVDRKYNYFGSLRHTILDHDLLLKFSKCR